MMKDEELWKVALISRNIVAHAYNHDIAKDIISQTTANYYQMFVDLKAEIEKNWK